MGTGRGEPVDSPRRLLARQRAEFAVRLRIDGLSYSQIAAYPAAGGVPLYPGPDGRKRAFEAVAAQMARAQVLPAGDLPRGAGRRPRTVRAASVVYYMRVGNRCKIGMTRNLPRRLHALTPEELLGTEPGGRQVEARRHEQFAALRTNNEWFRFEGPLVEFVAAALDPGTRLVGEF